ncbi:ribosome maturation factor RimM, partial [Roseicyclus sp.]|uniref:ribosome maturation factor RimM n=1 Tax=Roseicyclus sp. TaxID=1914329 RepID=UPI003F9F6F88
RSFEIRLTGAIKGGLAARLSGVATKEQADALRGLRLYAPREALPALPDDEFYHADLIGLEAYDTGGAPLGRVAAVLNHGAGDLLELRGPGLKGAVLVPFTQAIVPTVDLASGRLVIDPPEGLLD